jgi:hypothetical protein
MNDGDDDACFNRDCGVDAGMVKTTVMMTMLIIGKI